tara:strand:+ start:25558 stop:27480 length:1923 start_codon:yes stop_codon:yes gene_type:complete
MVLKIKKVIQKQFINFVCSRKFNHYRRTVLVLLDLFSINTSLFLAYWFCKYQLDELMFKNILNLIPATSTAILIVYYFTGAYRGISKYVGSKSIYEIFSRNFLIILSIYFYSKIFNYNLESFKFFFLFWIFSFCFIGLNKLIIRDTLIFFNKINISNKFIKRVVIYGAGQAGAALYASLKTDDRIIIKAFIDDDKRLWNRNIGSIPIKSFSYLENEKLVIDNVFFAIPSLNRSKTQSILCKVQDLGIKVLRMPSLEDIESGKSKIDSLTPVSLEDLLSKKSTSLNTKIIEPNIEGLNIAITGAGGSIGSELCQQLLSLDPNKIILIEQNELGLYNLLENLNNQNNQKVTLIPKLGNATKKAYLEEIFLQENINLVFHAAAYKHVPLVEINPLNGIYNNVFSTLSVCEAALNTNVSEVLLISTDKAVRPTNVMGASKRLAEIIIRYFDKKSSSNSNKKVCFSMVRFGNVLESSGSVIPLFKNQIMKGGPVTITHPQVYRYFMTIPQAVHLVLQSSFLAKGGEVFILDMGEPVSIRDMAIKLIQLSGNSIKTDTHPEGDIEIKVVGLRPGEKLHEELLIDAEAQITKHPLIFMAKDQFFEDEQFFDKLELLRKNIHSYKKKEVFKILSDLVPEWKKSKDLKN